MEKGALAKSASHMQDINCICGAILAHNMCSRYILFLSGGGQWVKISTGGGDLRHIRIMIT